MTESAPSNTDVPLEASIPDGAVSLESILCTEELCRRQSRPPDYQKENRALVALASALVDSQSNILQTLAETILDATRSDSSRVSLLTTDDGENVLLAGHRRHMETAHRRRDSARFRSVRERARADLHVCGEAGKCHFESAESYPMQI
jgi:hypothetical protein